MNRRTFLRFFGGALVGLGIKPSPIISIFPGGVPWISDYDKQLRLLNDITNCYVFPKMKFKMFGEKLLTEKDKKAIQHFVNNPTYRELAERDLARR